MLKNVLLALTSVILALVALEGMLRTVYEPPPKWIEPQTKHLRSPLLGWVLPPRSQSYTIDAPVSVNSLGLRDDEFPRSKPQGETRVLVLGDSFTFALGVRFEELYVQRLERRLNGRHTPRTFQAINAGIAGYNTRQELIYLLSEGLALEPDLLVVGFYWNDLLGNEAPLPDLVSTPKVSPDSEIYERGVRDLEHAIPAFIRDRLRKSLLLYLGVQGAKIGWDLVRPSQQEPARVQRALLSGDQDLLVPYWEATAQRLHELSDVAHAHDVPVILLVFPMENQIKRSYPHLVWSEKVREIWAATHFPIVDVDLAYRHAREGGRNPFLAYDQHPSPYGMEIAADALYTEIRRQGYLGLDRE